MEGEVSLCCYCYCYCFSQPSSSYRKKLPPPHPVRKPLKCLHTFVKICTLLSLSLCVFQQGPIRQTILLYSAILRRKRKLNFLGIFFSDMWEEYWLKMFPRYQWNLHFCIFHEKLVGKFFKTPQIVLESHF